MTKNLDAFPNFIISGLNIAVPNPGSLTATLNPGTAYLNGTRVIIASQAAFTNTYPPSSAIYVSVNNAGSVNYSAGSSAPSGYVLIAQVTSNSSNITSVQPLLLPLKVTPEHFRAIGNGEANDAPAFVAALEFLVSIGGGVLHLRAVRYNLGTNFITTNGTNSLVPLPILSTSGPYIDIVISGDFTVRAAGAVAPNSGTVLLSQATGSGTLPSLIGAVAQNSGTPSWTNLGIHFKKIKFQTQTNGGVIGANLYSCVNGSFEDVTADINSKPGGFVPPTIISTGLILPGPGNFGISYAEKFYITGYYYGLQHASHARLNGLIQNCVSAITIPESYSHIASYQRVTTQGCSYSIFCGAASGKATEENSICGVLDIERDTSFPFVDDIHVAFGASLNGSLIYNVAADNMSFISIAGPGSNNLMLFSAAMGQYVTPLAKIIVTSKSITVTPTANNTEVYPENLPVPITVTVEPGKYIGQSVTVYGHYSGNVTVASNVTSGEPAFYLPNNVAVYTYIMQGGNGSAQNIKLIWNGGAWNAYTQGSLFLNTVSVTANFSIAGTGGGSIVMTPPLQGVFKVVSFMLTGYMNNTATAQTQRFPTVFTQIPIILGNNTGINPTLSTNGITWPVSMTAAASGNIIIGGQ
ncbi:hypothetical protein HF670_00010 [Acidithiobacillus thiooxidans]|jgi:hypothetical protein|nr:MULTISPECIES: hypothetical protein [Acidithiobacillus]MDA8151587.1 hypothetical protein [Acidithiobacillus sp.]MBE7566684.1 hypothetical protein [Acidithiobacillus sp. HP-11]MBU2749543.1 hypothetical protein [Acidithiobacillus thiooxidans]MBU2836300.1 hypothetical protein [Acidithiobacillus thiooxidans]MBU2837977.1 hypothetical protein [Acidithiobacillus thiooxidans]